MFNYVINKTPALPRAGNKPMMKFILASDLYITQPNKDFYIFNTV